MIRHPTADGSADGAAPPRCSVRTCKTFMLAQVKPDDLSLFNSPVARRNSGGPAGPAPRVVTPAS